MNTACHCVLVLQQAQSHASTAALARSTQHSLSHTRVSIKLVSCTVRAAFSHIPFLQSLMWMVNNIALVPTMGNVAADVKLPTGIAAVEQVGRLPLQLVCSAAHFL